MLENWAVSTIVLSSTRFFVIDISPSGSTRVVRSLSPMERNPLPNSARVMTSRSLAATFAMYRVPVCVK